MRKLITLLIILVLGFLAFSHMYMLYVCDVSLAPVQPECQEEVHLVSYADGPDVFKQNQNFQAYTAINKGISHIHMYRRKDLDAEFVEKNKAILDQKKGAGYWLWKPYVILKTLNAMPENAILFYLDSEINLMSSIYIFIDRLAKNDMLLIKWDPHPNQKTVADIGDKEILDEMGCRDDACLASPHLWAAIGVYRNTVRTRHFVQKWLNACENDKWLTSRLNDETILSALASQERKDISIITTGEILYKNICWNHRHPEVSAKSLLPYTFELSKNFIRKMYWAWSYPLLCLRAHYREFANYVSSH